MARSIVRHLIGRPVLDVFAGVGAVEVPAPVVKLHEADAALDQAAGEQAIVREAGGAGLGAIIGNDTLRLTRNFHHFRHCGLHAEGELILGNAQCAFRGCPIRRLAVR